MTERICEFCAGPCGDAGHMRDRHALPGGRVIYTGEHHCCAEITLTDADVIAVLLREVADAAFRAGVKANDGLPTLGELKAAREKHVEEVIERWRSASSDKQ